MQAIDRGDIQKKMYQVIGAAMVVYNEVGYGLAEPIYQEFYSSISAIRRC
jgi:hypothetical protein